MPGKKKLNENQANRQGSERKELKSRSITPDSADESVVSEASGSQAQAQCEDSSENTWGRMIVASQGLDLYFSPWMTR